MKIFWSWQSDTPGKTGRFLVRDALQEAIQHLKEPPDIEEPTAKENREALHLDHDLKGTTGSPDLARTIFDKIDVSEVVVADITLVGQTPDSADDKGETVSGKKLINSNVAIELGYALRAVSDRCVLMVFNEHFGKHEDLPFDLRHKGGSIVFDLAPDADQKRIDAEKKKLKDQFVAKLKPYLGKAAPAAAVPPFEETPSTFSNAAYFKKGEVLAQVGVPGEDEVRFSYATDALCYIRLIPTQRAERPLPLARLTSEIQYAPLLNRQPGGLNTQNDHGAIIYEPGSNPPRGSGKLNASTQLFENGEIWSVSGTLIIQERGGRPASVKIPMLHSLTFEQIYNDKLRALAAFASKHLGVPPPWQIECGIVGIKGVFLHVPPDEFRGPIRKSEIIHRMVVNDEKPASIDAFLLAFFERVHDATGYARPQRLHGFPPAHPK
jgi:hypothetical protein